MKAANVAFDIGGTFTDIVGLLPDGSFMIEKVLSDSDLVTKTRLFIEGCLRRSEQPQLSTLLHGTTVATNALLQGNGPVIGLLTTRGFRDEIEIRREARPSVFDFGWQRQPPLIPRRRRREVNERVNARGDVVVPLDVGETRDALLGLRGQGIKALAICFFNSYANPIHERAAEALARELLPDVSVCISYDVLPQVREYERASTTSVNAYLLPVVRDYLDHVERELGPFSPTLRIMQSNGGMMTSAHARRAPIYAVESGPAGGVIAAAALARETGIRGAVSFDMGGTTAKACLIEGGVPVERTDYEVGGRAHGGSRHDRGLGYAVSVPSFDLVEVGAGGGSIARIQDGAVRVGPVSAGAVPGPAAYGAGGVRPTVTDANIVLGYMSPEYIAGGTVPIDLRAARHAIDHDLGTQLNRSTRDIAYGIFEVANAAMRRAVRAVTTERGLDPRAYSLIAFGGAGPVHAAALADMLDIKSVYVPLFPGLFSAVGLLLSDLRYDRARSLPARLDDPTVGHGVMAAYESLIAEVLDQTRREKLDPDLVVLERLIDLRYSGQSSELTLRLPTEPDPQQLGSVLSAEFHSQHERLYGYRRDSEPIQVVNVRIRASASTRTTSFRDIGEHFVRDAGRAGSPEAARLAYFGPDLGEQETRLIDRRALLSRDCPGPVIIEEFSTTVVVPPGWRARLDDFADIVLERA
jgi:N-methylhydantoinase A